MRATVLTLGTRDLFLSLRVRTHRKLRRADVEADLFGCRRARPLARPGAGLLWAVSGGRLVELHRDWAVIELAANGSRHVFERRRVDAGKLTLPWIERGRGPGDV